MVMCLHRYPKFETKMQILTQISRAFLTGANLSAGHELHNVIIEKDEDTNNLWYQMSSENHWVCLSKFKVISHNFFQIMCFCASTWRARKEDWWEANPFALLHDQLLSHRFLSSLPFQPLRHMLDMLLKTNAFLYVITNLHSSIKTPISKLQTPSTFKIQEETTLGRELTGGEIITTRHSLVHTKDNFETIKKCSKLKFAC